MTEKTAAVVLYSELRAQLAELAENNKKLVFDYESPLGNKDARSYLYRLRQTRSSLDRARKTEKQASLEYGRQVDAQAKELEGQLDAMIEVHEAPLKAIEKRETDRKELLNARMMEVVTYQTLDPVWDAAQLETRIDALMSIAVDCSWQEYAEEAQKAKDLAMYRLEDALGKRRQYDADQAELVRLRKAQEEQARKDREDRIAKEAAERERSESTAREQKLKDDAAKAARESSEREARQKADNERLQREAAESEQRAKDAATDTERRLKQESDAKARVEAVAKAKREADAKHRVEVDNAAIGALVAGGVDGTEARRAITLIAAKSIPAVSIAY